MASSLKAARRGARSTLGRAGLIVSALAVVAALVSGCAYRFGNGTLYPPEIRTVHVPMFDSVSLRRGLGERLTEAVVRDIELKTPFKVVDSVGADSTLTGRITSEYKGTVLVAPTSEPRSVNLTYSVEVVWTDRRGTQLQSRSIPLPTSIATVDQPSFLIPEAGQSLATTQQKIIDQLAQQIVALMESPW